MDNKPQIPTLKESQNEKKGGAPALKIKGLQSGLSLIERLKQFKKKDLAFILAGLGVLFMAPLAEHFMMAPDSGQGSDQMTPGFSQGKGASPFGSGSSPYEPGISGLAPGGVAGSGSDVITPLNVRDPSALVMGPGATQQPPATASAPATPPPPPPAHEDSKWNDAIAAGKAAASSAVKKAALPVPKVPLSAGGLRGLGAVSGGSGSSFSLAPISSNGLASGHVNQSNGLTGTSNSGFKGVARGPGSGGNTKGLEALKNAAANAGGDFNRAGSAATNLENAASQNMGGGSGGGAGEGGSKDDKATSGSQSKDSKSPGESLEFLRQKMQMEKDIAFADELRKSDPSCVFKGGPCLERNKIMGKVLETTADSIAKAGFDNLIAPFFKRAGKTINGTLNPDSSQPISCMKMDGSGPKLYSAGSWAPSCTQSDLDGFKGDYCLGSDGMHLITGAQADKGTLGQGTQDSKTPCTSDPTNKDGKNKTDGGANGVPKVDGGNGQTLAAMCAKLKEGSTVTNTNGIKTVDTGDQGARLAANQALLQDAIDMAAVKKVLGGDGADYDACKGMGTTRLDAKYLATKNVPDMIKATKDATANTAGYLRAQVLANEDKWRPDLFNGKDGLEPKLFDQAGNALKPETVNVGDQTTGLTDVKKSVKDQAEGFKGSKADKPAVEMATDARQKWATIGNPKDTAWTDINAAIGQIDETIKAAQSTLTTASTDAQTKVAADKEGNAAQIGGYGKQQQTRLGTDQGDQSQLQQGYQKIVDSLDPKSGAVAQAHGAAQALLIAGGDQKVPTEGITPLLDKEGKVPAAGADGGDKTVAGQLTSALDKAAQIPNMFQSAEENKTARADANQKEKVTAIDAALKPISPEVDTIKTTAQQSSEKAGKAATDGAGVFTSLNPFIGTVPGPEQDPKITKPDLGGSSSPTPADKTK